jgi:hypothetical protein
MAEHFPSQPEPTGDALDQAQRIINNAYYYGEAAAQEAQFLLYSADQQDPDVAVLHEMKDVVDKSLDRFPAPDESLPDPVGQALLAVNEAERQIELEEAARPFIELNKKDPRLSSPNDLSKASFSELHRLIAEIAPPAAQPDYDPTEQTREMYMRQQNRINPRKPKNEIVGNVPQDNQQPDYRPQVEPDDK